MTLTTMLTDLANPTKFLSLTARVLPWLAAATAILLAIGLYLSAMAPDDYQQGATVKIMFIHVPNAWLSMFVWGVMSVAALGTLVWRHPLADVAAKAAAPIGAAFTFLALVTGSLWGRPMWGTYWEWDARLTSVLILFLMYLGLMALWRAVDDPSRAGARRRDPDSGRRHQPADHQILGGLVEHAAPAGLGVPHGRPDARPRLPGAAAGDGAGVSALFVTLHLAAMRNEILRRRVRSLADDASQPACRRERDDRLVPTPLSSSASYALVAAVVLLLIVWIAPTIAASSGAARARGPGRRRRSGAARGCTMSDLNTTADAVAAPPLWLMALPLVGFVALAALFWFGSAPAIRREFPPP